MKKIITLFVALALCCVASAGTLKTETIVDQGLTRSYYTYIPDNLPAGAPLVFILHGYGGSASAYVNNASLTFKTLAEEYKVALCYPQATQDSKNTGWNVYYPWQIAAATEMKVDDCEFICNLAKHLQSAYNLSSKNVFLTGMSNGGEMCYLLAYRKPKEFAAIASMAGLTLVEMAKRHDYTEPVAFMEVHGTGDMTSRWEGDPTNQYGWGAYLSVPVAVGAVAAANKCMYEETTELPQLKNRVIRHRYYGAPSGKEVWFYEVRNGGHNWATDSFDSCRTIMEFFKMNLVK